MHLLRIETKPGCVRLHDGDAADETFVATTLFLNLFGKPANLAFEVVLLDRDADDEHVLPLQLLSRVDLAIESYLYSVVGLIRGPTTLRTSSAHSSGGCFSAIAKCLIRRRFSSSRTLGLDMFSPKPSRTGSAGAAIVFASVAVTESSVHGKHYTTMMFT